MRRVLLSQGSEIGIGTVVQDHGLAKADISQRLMCSCHHPPPQNVLVTLLLLSVLPPRPSALTTPSHTGELCCRVPLFDTLATMQLSQALPRGRQAVSRLALPSPLSRRLSRPLGSMTAASWPSPPATPRQPRTPPILAKAAAEAGTTSARVGGRRHASSVPAADLRKTALYDLHVAHGAKMVPFGGFHMPVQYKAQSVLQSHHFTRSHASLFDVGHMVQHTFAGAGAAAFLQRVTPASLGALAPQHSTLSTSPHIRRCMSLKSYSSVF